MLCKSVGQLVLGLTLPLHAQPLSLLESLRNPTDLNPVSDGDGLILQVANPVQRRRDVLPEVGDLAVVRETEFRREDQGGWVRRFVAELRIRLCEFDRHAALPDADRAVGLLERGSEC